MLEGEGNGLISSQENFTFQCNYISAVTKYNVVHSFCCSPMPNYILPAFRCLHADSAGSLAHSDIGTQEVYKLLIWCPFIMKQKEFIRLKSSYFFAFL